MLREPRVALVVITDGRGEYLRRTIPSAIENLRSVFVSRTIVDDSGDAEYGSWLETAFPTFAHVHHDHREGLAGAVKTAWKTALAARPDYLWHQEEDFVFEAPIDIGAMARCLEEFPYLAQLVLKRQPWSREEKIAGGQIEVAPEEYVDFESHVEHNRLFSLNPCLIPARVIERCQDEELERGITDACLGEGWRFAYWGQRHDAPLCEHIGEHRSAGYRW